MSDERGYIDVSIVVNGEELHYILEVAAENLRWPEILEAWTKMAKAKLVDAATASIVPKVVILTERPPNLGPFRHAAAEGLTCLGSPS